MMQNEVVLSEVMKETADAIREKTGKSDLIAPVDFATEIKGISAGGGDAPSGGSNMEYLDLSGVEEGQLRNFLVAFASRLNLEITEGGLTGAKMAGITWGYLDMMLDSAVNPNWAKAIAIDLTTNIIQEEGGQQMALTFRELITALGLNPADIDAIPRLTKEQFYDLNA